MKQRKSLNEEECKRNAYVKIWFGNPIRSIAHVCYVILFNIKSW